jgi:hypothetical protein
MANGRGMQRSFQIKLHCRTKKNALRLVDSLSHRREETRQTL